jgi:hypothetical protein
MNPAYLTTFVFVEIRYTDVMNPISDLKMSNFVQDQGKQRIARRRTDQYAAQVILQLDADIGQKGHF